MSEVTCTCGEVLTGEKNAVYETYMKHQRNESHRPSPAQWTDAHNLIVEAKERAKASSAKK